MKDAARSPRSPHSRVLRRPLRDQERACRASIDDHENMSWCTTGSHPDVRFGLPDHCLVSVDTRRIPRQRETKLVFVPLLQQPLFREIELYLFHNLLKFLLYVDILKGKESNKDDWTV